MNNTERKFSEQLDEEVRGGTILDYWFEAFTFLLGERCTYTPDFVVLRPDGVMEVFEIKGGHIWEQGRVKLKAFAEAFPFKTTLCVFKNKQWTLTEVGRD